MPFLFCRFCGVVLGVFLVSAQAGAKEADVKGAAKPGLSHCINGLCVDAKMARTKDTVRWLQKLRTAPGTDICATLGRTNACMHINFSDKAKPWSDLIEVLRCKDCEGLRVTASFEKVTTDRGLSLGASEKDVRRIYGTPRTVSTTNSATAYMGDRLLEYFEGDPLMAGKLVNWFGIKGGRVVYMAVTTGE